MHRRQLLRIRAAAFERRVLSSPSWRDPGFTIWGAGRDGRNLLNALGNGARAKATAFCDVDPKKIGTSIVLPPCAPLPPLRIPVVHFREATAPFVM